MYKAAKYLMLPFAILFLFLYFFAQSGKIHVNKGNSAPLSATTTPVLKTTTLEPISILFVGDIMLDREVAVHAQKYGADTLFSGMEAILRAADIVVGNLEGAITHNDSVSIVDHSILRFTFAPKFATVLKRANITVVSLANNHALDFGRDGFDETKKYLTDARITSFGSPLNNDQLSVSVTKKGRTLCFVGYHDFFVPDPAPLLLEIEKIRPQCAHITVFAHWGEEYKGAPNERQKMLAHQFIDTGADLVIGAHPHVVEPIEIYHNRAIFYSLGNFMFDQNFSFATEHGVAVLLELRGEESHYTFIPVSIKHAEVQIVEGVDHESILSFLVDDGLPSIFVSAIKESHGFTLSSDGEIITSSIGL